MSLKNPLPLTESECYRLIKDLKLQRKEFMNNINMLHDERAKLKGDISYKKMGELVNKYGNFGCNKFYISRIDIRIKILKDIIRTKSWDTSNYKSMAII